LAVANPPLPPHIILTGPIWERVEEKLNALTVNVARLETALNGIPKRLHDVESTVSRWKGAIAVLLVLWAVVGAWVGTWVWAALGFPR